MAAGDPAGEDAQPHSAAGAAWLAEAACSALVLRSAALVDAGDAVALAALFSEDGVLVRPGGAPVTGRSAIEQAYRARPAGRTTVHVVCGTLFDEVFEDHALATSRVLVWTAQADSLPGPHGRPAEPLQRLGHFVDHFVRTVQGWRIGRRTAAFDLFRD